MPINASRDKVRQELDDLGMSHLFAKSLGKSEKCRHVCAFVTILFCRVLVIILMVVVILFANSYLQMMLLWWWW